MKRDSKKYKRIHLEFFDETLRDGEQQVAVTFAPEQKEKLAHHIALTGVTTIDIMAGVHCSENEVIKKLAARSLPIAPACMMRKKMVESALTLGVKRITFFYPVSDILLKIDKKTRAEALNFCVKWCRYAYSKGLIVDFAAEDATRADFDYLVEVGRAVLPCIDTLLVCDTVGCLQPNWSYKLVKDFISATGCKTGVHYHNDLGLAVENTVQGVLAGARVVSGTFTGIGERAGNAALEKVLAVLKRKHRIVVNTIDYKKVAEVCALIKEVYRFKPAQPLSRASFYTETGIHVRRLLVDLQSYILFPQEKPIIWFGKYSGASNFKWLFEREFKKQPLLEKQYQLMRDQIKELAVRENRSFSSDEVRNGDIVKKYVKNISY